MSLPVTPADASGPLLSVLLVTYGALEWTERCLASLFASTEVPFEVICVDNASPDGTADRLAAMSGIQLIRSPTNLGYGVAANLAALKARAPYLLLLNSDAIVQPGWFSPLEAVLRENEDIAAVSPRLLHIDGRLQEAGSVIWGDGATDCYGDGDDPDRPEYRFRRDVDYASAACLLVRRSAFVNAGGFDPLYQPAYHEDTDLAMRWRSRGMRIVYQPESTAVHKRWASSVDREATERLVERHRPLFAARWPTLISRRPVRPPTRAAAALTAIRDAECGDRLLGVTDRLDSPVGGVVVELLCGLGGDRPGVRRSLLCRTGADDPAAETLRSNGIEVVGLPTWSGWLAARMYHYTCLVVSEDVWQAVSSDLASTQPLAAAVLAVQRGAYAPGNPSGWLRWPDLVVHRDVLAPEPNSTPVPAVCLDDPGALDEVAAAVSLRFA